MPRYNPFRPGAIVTPGMFSGRVEELVALERVLFQTKNGNSHHFLIQGERGIGKSSLISFLQYVARGDLKGLEAESFKFLTVKVELEPSDGYSEIITKIGAELHRAVADHQRVKQVVKSAWEFLQRWEVMGVRYRREDRARVDPHDLLNDLIVTVEKTVAETRPEFNGILILIDEADKPPSTSNLGEFCKLFTERLTSRGCEYVSLGLAGLSTLLGNLSASHESSPRIFEILSLEPLLPNERVDVIRKGLKEARDKNGFDVLITEEAERWVSTFSEGYPHFIQQFAYSAFDADTDNNIDIKDALMGAFRENGAFHQIGLKYFQGLYFEQIGSDEYREVLKAMADYLDEYVSKKQIRAASQIKESTLTNAIRALTDRNIIIPKKGKKGVYRLPTKSFAVWIKMLTAAPENRPDLNA